MKKMSDFILFPFVEYIEKLYVELIQLNANKFLPFHTNKKRAKRK